MPVPAARARAIRRHLLSWWDAGHRRLPWRFPQHAADPYRVWVAEVMLQQTQVAVVVPYFERFVQRFPSLESLAAASDDAVIACWSGLGYYARARRLRAAALAAVERHGGLPASLDALAALPGFGRYTAGAVASIAFGIPAACVDGNIARVLSRLFLVDGHAREARTRERLWAIAAALVAPDRPGDLNQALMELGAVVCTRAAPRCDDCPLAHVCEARAAGRHASIPAPRLRIGRRRLVVACALVRRGSEMLVAQRPAGGLFGGLWELPSAEVPAGGDARACLTSGLAERLGLRIVAGEELASVERTLTHRQLRLTAYACRLPRAVDLPRGVRFAGSGWLEASGLATAMRRLIEALGKEEASPPSPPGRLDQLQPNARPDLGVEGSVAYRIRRRSRKTRLTR